MNYRFFNAKIMVGVKIIDGELWVQGNKIAYIGQCNSDKIMHFDEEIDLDGKLIMPGLIDMHTHTSMSWARNLSNETCLQEWWGENIYPCEQKMNGDDFYWTTLYGIKELVRGGVTTCLDMYINNIETYKAFDKAKFRAVLSLFPSEIKLIENNKNDLIKFCMQIHSVYAVDDDEIAKVVTLANKFKIGINMHLSETLQEMGECNLKNGCTPTEYLDGFGVFDRPCICAHCVCLDDGDYSILSSNGASIVLNNSANLKLGSGIAPAYTMMKRGINVCIGTDGAGSNNHIDMFKEMFLTATLSKGLMHDSKAITNEDVIKMATINASKALNIEGIGELKEGNFADLVVLDINEPNYRPTKNLEKGLVYCANSKDVVLTMVNGNILYRDGCYYLGEDDDKINKKFDEVVERITEV